MRDFEVGDSVVIVKDFDIWSDGEFPESTVLTVVDNDPDNYNYINPEALTIEVDGVNYNKGDFKLVDAPFGGFIGVGTGLIGEAASETIMPMVRNEPARFGSPHLGAVVELPKEVVLGLQGYKDALTKSHEDRDPEILGVYRPDVENRKVDKIRIELFDDGFPNAILEIAKVLTWAQKVKGYKDHDWVNLPDAENSLKGAASRHRRDANQQKMEGVPAKDRIDHESKHHHLAHQAFNILAELELILTGKIS